MARPLRILVRRRDRSEGLCEGEGGGPAQRAADQPQPAFSSNHSSDLGNGRGGIGRCRSGVALDISKLTCDRRFRALDRVSARSVRCGGSLMKTLLLVVDLAGTFVF